MRKKQFLCGVLAIFCLMTTGCSNDTNDENKYPTEYPVTQGYSIDDVLLPNSPETLVMEDQEQRVHIDYSNTSLGYIRIKRLLASDEKMKVQILHNTATLEEGQSFPYYDLNKTGVYETFPLVYGSGSYTILVYKNTGPKKYMKIYTGEMQVNLETEETPFLYPNQTVDYDQNSKAIQLSFELCKENTTDLQRVKTLYEYVVNTISYDEEKSEATQNTYILPVIDETLETKKGICFDYAALLAAMYRAQHIPCKVVVGDTSIEYHAWVEVWLEGQGWIDPATLFEPEEWTRMDPTFAASKAEYDGYYKTIFEY